MFDETNGGFGSAPKFPHPSIDRPSDRSVFAGRRGGSPFTAEQLKHFATTLEKMARGGVYDQLAGGFHRYSVDERWIVPTSRKCHTTIPNCSRTTSTPITQLVPSSFRTVARDIIRWTDEWLSDRQHGGFYASQDADISLDDDGDYFTWTVDEAKAVLYRTRGASRESALRHQRNRRDASQSGKERPIPARSGVRDFCADEACHRNAFKSCCNRQSRKCMPRV